MLRDVPRACVKEQHARDDVETLVAADLRDGPEAEYIGEEPGEKRTPEETRSLALRCDAHDDDGAERRRLRELQRVLCAGRVAEQTNGLRSGAEVGGASNEAAWLHSPVVGEEHSVDHRRFDGVAAHLRRELRVPHVFAR